MARFRATLWSWTLLSTAEKVTILLAILIGLGFAALTVGHGYDVGAHVGRAGWICDETVKGGVTCRPDPASAMGR